MMSSGEMQVQALYSIDGCRKNSDTISGEVRTCIHTYVRGNTTIKFALKRFVITNNAMFIQMSQ